MSLVSQTQQVLGVLSDRYKVDLIEGNLSRRTDDRIYWKSDGAFESAMTDGLGSKNHIALRNYQIRQPVQNMNGQWKTRINKKELQTILTELEEMIYLFQYEECFDYLNQDDLMIKV